MVADQLNQLVKAGIHCPNGYLDYLPGQLHQIEQATADATPQAFLPVKERDLFNLGSQPTVMGELNPAYQGPIFPDFCLEQPELESIMGDQVPQKIKAKILAAVRQAHLNNLQRVQQWDSKVRSLYSAASGLVNNGIESIRGYRQIQAALDIHQQSILRRACPFVKSPSSYFTDKPSKDKGSTCAVSSAYNVERKRRSRGKGRKIRGLSPHPIPPPVSALPRTSTPVPAEQPIVFRNTDARPQYRQAALGGLQQSGSGDRPPSPVRVKPRADPPSTPAQGDLQDRLVGRQLQTSRA